MEERRLTAREEAAELLADAGILQRPYAGKPWKPAAIQLAMNHLFLLVNRIQIELQEEIKKSQPPAEEKDAK